MSDSGQYDSRLAELIWRSVKLRISILLFCIFCLLTTWSSLEMGNRKVQEVDKAFCLKIAANTQQLFLLENRSWLQQNPSSAIPTPESLDAGAYCASIEDTHYWILYQQAALEITLANPKEPEDQKKLEQAIWKSLSDYSARRNEAFRIDLKAASEFSENDIEVNALSVAAVIPFLVMGMLVLYFMLGYQESGLTNQLRLELESIENRGATSQDLFAAKSQYFVSPRDRVGVSRLLEFLTACGATDHFPAYVPSKGDEVTRS